VENVDKNLILV